MSASIETNSWNNSYTVTDQVEVSIEFSATDLLSGVSDRAIADEANDRGMYVGTDVEEVIKQVKDAGEERTFLEGIDNSEIVRVCGADELLLTFDSEDIANISEGGALDEFLSKVDSEYIQKYMVTRGGGFTLESVNDEDLLGAVEQRNLHTPGFTLTSEVIHAAHVMNEFTTMIFNSRDGYKGKRFHFPTE